MQAAPSLNAALELEWSSELHALQLRSLLHAEPELRKELIRLASHLAAGHADNAAFRPRAPAGALEGPVSMKGVVGDGCLGTHALQSLWFGLVEA